MHANAKYLSTPDQNCSCVLSCSVFPCPSQGAGHHFSELWTSHFVVTVFFPKRFLSLQDLQAYTSTVIVQYPTLVWTCTSHPQRIAAWSLRTRWTCNCFEEQWSTGVHWDIYRLYMTVLSVSICTIYTCDMSPFREHM